MLKRLISAALWAYVTWYACNVLGAFAGVGLPGALLGTLAAIAVLGWPLLRTERATSSRQLVAQPTGIADN